MTDSELEEYLETYYEVVSIIEEKNSNAFGSSDTLMELYNTHGRGALWELAKSITDDFQSLNKNREWDGEFLEEIQRYTLKRIEQL